MRGFKPLSELTFSRAFPTASDRVGQGSIHRRRMILTRIAVIESRLTPSRSALPPLEAAMFEPRVRRAL
jgi:hypothetical protein